MNDAYYGGPYGQNGFSGYAGDRPLFAGQGVPQGQQFSGYAGGRQLLVGPQLPQGQTRKRLAWYRRIRWFAVPKRRAAGHVHGHAHVIRPARTLCSFPCLLAAVVIAILITIIALIVTMFTVLPNDDTCKDLGCSYSCQLQQGSANSYECYCYNGYELGDDMKSCIDIDECPNITCGTGLQCVNTNGSYYCGCNDGWVLNTALNICEDIDECLQSPCWFASTCTNHPGNFTCSCTGVLTYNYTEKVCEEPPLINECLNSTCPVGCMNTRYSYECICYEGYTYNVVSNKCDYKPVAACDCEGSCHPKPNSVRYTCSCDDSKGLYLAADGKSCIYFGFWGGTCLTNTACFPDGQFNYHITSNKPQTVKFICSIEANVSIEVGDGSNNSPITIIWLNNDGFRVPGNPFVDDDKYQVSKPVSVFANNTLWQSTITVTNPVVPDDLGTYTCIISHYGIHRPYYYDVTAPKKPPKPCLYDVRKFPCLENVWN